MRRWLAMLGVTALATMAAAGAGAGPARADSGAPSCVVNYDVIAAFYGYFYAEATVEFSGFPAAIGWQLGFDFVSPQQQILSLESDQLSVSGQDVIVTNDSQATSGNGAAEVSFVASKGSADPAPANFTFDGVACAIGTGTTTTT